MAYSDFKLDELKTKFGLKFVEHQRLFVDVPRQPLTPEALAALARYKFLALTIHTEKARSEYIIAPFLAELKLMYPETLSLFSGIEFNVDKKSGLVGRCDFIISRAPENYILTDPVVVMVEAKNDNNTQGIPQCIAEMIAAQRFNERKGQPISPIYGAVTTGSLWRFLKLERQTVFIDITEYGLFNLDKIVGVLAFMVGCSPAK